MCLLSWIDFRQYCRNELLCNPNVIIKTFMVYAMCAFQEYKYYECRPEITHAIELNA